MLLKMNSAEAYTEHCTDGLISKIIFNTNFRYGKLIE